LTQYQKKQSADIFIARPAESAVGLDFIEFRRVCIVEMSFQMFAYLFSVNETCSITEKAATSFYFILS